MVEHDSREPARLGRRQTLGLLEGALRLIVASGVREKDAEPIPEVGAPDGVHALVREAEWMNLFEAATGPPAYVA